MFFLITPPERLHTQELFGVWGRGLFLLSLLPAESGRRPAWQSRSLSIPDLSWGVLYLKPAFTLVITAT